MKSEKEHSVNLRKQVLFPSGGSDFPVVPCFLGAFAFFSSALKKLASSSIKRKVIVKFYDWSIDLHSDGVDTLTVTRELLISTCATHHFLVRFPVGFMLSSGSQTTLRITWELLENAILVSSSVFRLH